MILILTSSIGSNECHQNGPKCREQSCEQVVYVQISMNYDRAETQKRQKGKPKNCQKATKSAKSAQNGKFPQPHCCAPWVVIGVCPVIAM